MLKNLGPVFLLILLLFILLHAQSRAELRARTTQDWLLDGVSLGCFFIIMPVLQVLLGYQLYALLVPKLRGTLELSWGMSVLIYALIDYAWYWNHRLFHAQTPLWNLHAVHHEAERLDIFASQRNSVWSFLFMTYFWLTPLVSFVAKDPAPFLILSALGMLINFWGHTLLDLPKDSMPRRLLSLAIIQPEDHFWHHSEENPYCNFATVFNFWDKLHGTWYQPNVGPKHLGFRSKLPLWRKLIFPV
jgi:sterol desaturase/sphingolipid hydroxylase (fatty acid hydroxylase superfamily)